MGSGFDRCSQLFAVDFVAVRPNRALPSVSKGQSLRRIVPLRSTLHQTQLTMAIQAPSVSRS
jgi:hypothetical protein